MPTYETTGRAWARGIRRAATSLWLILAVAFAARLLYAARQERLIPTAVLATVPFAQETGNVAASLAAGRGFSQVFRQPTGPTAWLSPAYPLLISAVFRVFGTFTLAAFQTAVLLNILFSAGACVALFFAGKKIGGMAVAAGGAWLWAVLPNGVIIPFQWIWETSLAALLAATILWATLAIAESERARDWAGYGVLWGFALMTDAALAAAAPFLFAWLVFRRRRQGRPIIALPALAAGVLVLSLAPWTARNYARFHRVIPLRSNFAFELWIGNNEVLDPNGRNVMARVTAYEQTRRYQRLGETAFLNEKWRLASSFIRTHPRLELWLTRRRFLAFWTGSPNPVIDFRDASSRYIQFLYLSSALAALGAAAGIFVLWRRGNRYAFPASIFPLVYPCVYYVTHASLRYRHPIDPILMLLAAVAIADPARPPDI